MQKYRVAVVCGYSSSKHAIALLAGLALQKHVEIVFCSSVRTLSYKRISMLVRRYGWRDSWEKFMNVFVSSKGNRFHDETRFITEFLVQNNIKYSNVREACRGLGVSLFTVSSLNDDKLHTKLKESRIDLLIYSGGGILRKRVIELANLGVLNAHAGPLPFFRGMNGVEWSLMHNVKPEVTVHLIDSGIDTGPILMRAPIDIEEGDTLYSLRGKSVVAEVMSILKVVENFDSYFRNKTMQYPQEGRQFFPMHEILKNIIDTKLQNGWRPKLRYEEFEAQGKKLA